MTGSAAGVWPAASPPHRGPGVGHPGAKHSLPGAERALAAAQLSAANVHKVRGPTRACARVRGVRAELGRLGLERWGRC